MNGRMPDFVGHGVIMRFGKMLVGLVALFVMLFSAGQALARQVVPVVDFVDVPVVTTSGLLWRGDTHIH